MKTTKKQQSGRSMIEMVGVLAVMGLITAAAFVLINSALASQRLSRLDDDVSGIVQGVRLLYNSQSDFAGVNAAESGKPAGNSTLVLLGFGNDDKPYLNPYGGNYELTSDNAADKRTFAVKITGLGSKTCSVLSTRDWNGGGIVVDGEKVTANANEAVTSCGAADSTNFVTVRYEKADTKTNP